MRKLLFSVLVLTLSFVLCETVTAQKFRVLITNDDGVAAEGISALVGQLSLNPNLDLTVIAPAKNKSGTGDEFSTDESFTVTAAATSGGFAATTVSGMPADTVLFGVLSRMSEMPDLVVSGINSAQNYTDYVKHSGTVGAALTAARLGIPAIAMSQGLRADASVLPDDYTAASVYAGNLVELVRTNRLMQLKMKARNGLDHAMVLNVNFPTCPEGGIRGVRVVPLDQFNRVTAYTLIGDDGTTQTYQPVVEGTSSVPVPDCTSALTNEPSTDFEAFENGFASVTPLNPDMTVNFSSLSWFKFLENIAYNK